MKKVKVILLVVFCLCVGFISTYPTQAYAATTPSKVEKFKSKATGKQVKLTWKKAKADGYIIERSTDNKKWTTIATIKKNSTTKYWDKNLKANKKYYYRIKAYIGKKKSGGVTTKILTAPSQTTLSFVTKDSENYRYSQDAVMLTIDSKVKGAVTYEIYKSTDNKNWKKIAISNTPREFVDKQVVKNKTYYYSIKTCNKNNACSDYSKSIKKKVSALSKPTDFSIWSTGDYVEFAWVGSNAADGYELKVSTDNKKWSKVKKIDYSGYYFTDGKEKTTYYFKVRAYNNVDGKKYTSGWAEFKIKNTTPKVENLTAIPADNGVTIKFKNPGYYYYEISRSTSKNGKYEVVDKLYCTACGDADEYYAVRHYYYEKNITKYSDTGLKANKTYYYKVKVGYSVNNKVKYSKDSIIEVKTLTKGKATTKAVNQINEWLNGKYGYSKNGLIEELMELGYSKNAATNAVGKVNINYKKQALKQLKLSLSNYWYPSKKEIEKNFKFLKFTKNEIKYAIEKSKVDFVSNAYELIKDELINYGYGEVGLRNTLTQAGFTKVEIDAVVKKVDFDQQALVAANVIIENASAGRNGIKKSLEIRGFTAAQAKYAMEIIDNSNIDYVKIATQMLNERTYLKNGSSKKSIIMELTSEYTGFTKEQVEQAIKNVNINFNNNAVTAAKAHTSSTYMSYSAKRLKNDLMSIDGYTESEAEYAVKNAGINFNEQAYKAIKNIDGSYYSRQSLINAFMGDNYGFTKSEAEYAINKANINFKERALTMAKDNLRDDYGRSANYIRNILSSNLFSNEEIEYVISLIDFKQEALKMARDVVRWYSASGLSKTQMRNLLNSESFTTDEIEYAVKNVGINYGENALSKANEYINSEYYVYSQQEIEGYLKDYNYDSDEISYAISKINWVSQAKRVIDDLLNTYKNDGISRHFIERELVKKGYSDTIITDAIDQLNINFNEQAVTRGRLLGYQYMTRANFINQLMQSSEFDYADLQFTQSEAEYAADQLGVN